MAFWEDWRIAEVEDNIRHSWAFLGNTYQGTETGIITGRGLKVAGPDEVSENKFPINQI